MRAILQSPRWIRRRTKVQSRIRKISLARCDALSRSATGNCHRRVNDAMQSMMTAPLFGQQRRPTGSEAATRETCKKGDAPWPKRTSAVCLAETPAPSAVSRSPSPTGLKLIQTAHPISGIAAPATTLSRRWPFSISMDQRIISRSQHECRRDVRGSETGTPPTGCEGRKADVPRCRDGWAQPTRRATTRLRAIRREISLRGR